MSYDLVKNISDFVALTTPEPDSEVLQIQINQGISSAECIGVVLDTPTITIQFDVQPSPSDLTIINNIVASHTGVGFVEGVQKQYTEGVQTETGTTYVQKASLQSGMLRERDYLISWYCELAVATADSTSGVLARVLWNGTERAESSNNISFYQSFSGVVIVSASALSTPSLSVELRRAGTANTAQIRRIRLAISPATST